MTVRYSAPGRVNLIGEHTDYNLGWSLPIALPQRTSVVFEPSAADELTVSSDLADDAARIPLTTKPGEVTGWAAYVAGVVWALRAAGHRIPGGVLSISSEVPVGSGLSSSAALECAVLGALCPGIDRLDQARLAQRAENEYVGAPTGLLDQISSLFGARATALLIDFRELTVTQVGFDPSSSGVELLLIDSRERHGHAGGEYAARRLSCERAAADMGVVSLREVNDVAALGRVTDPVDARRARHVLTENQRVLDFVAALRNSDYAAAGRIFTASHASMRDDFAITTPHIDRIARAAVDAGALGARMTGGGFGGCVIALVPASRVSAVSVAVSAAAGNQPVITSTYAAEGASAT
ncbi:galactokinase [Mycobacterium paraterrae]|uniref:Galactokinase n=1 Tax=Mycobacterium paraterrae TaxID=577492 RepID=A0ABY3VH97_9MYCO|nr:galactokinase [Mycobacterium paraterrae]UMB68804.1 galactokinase [Mycobacterium paraterrae]